MAKDGFSDKHVMRITALNWRAIQKAKQPFCLQLLSAGKFCLRSMDATMMVPVLVEEGGEFLSAIQRMQELIATTLATDSMGFLGISGEYLDSIDRLLGSEGVALRVCGPKDGMLAQSFDGKALAILMPMTVEFVGGGKHPDRVFLGEAARKLCNKVLEGGASDETQSLAEILELLAGS